MQKPRVKRHAVTQPSDPSYRFIPLTQNQNAIVDAADYEWLNQWNWQAAWREACKSFYAHRTQHTHGEFIGMHSLIMNCKNVDHKNHDTLDNRRGNLRRCTTSQNHYNRAKAPSNKSGFKGVCWSKEMHKWVVQIKVAKKNTVVGYFTSVEDAARAYDEAAKKLHGEFAYLNFPQAERPVIERAPSGQSPTPPLLP